MDRHLYGVNGRLPPIVTGTTECVPCHVSSTNYLRTSSYLPRQDCPKGDEGRTVSRVLPLLFLLPPYTPDDTRKLDDSRTSG